MLWVRIDDEEIQVDTKGGGNTPPPPSCPNDTRWPLFLVDRTWMELGQYTCSNPLGRWKLPTAMQLGLGQYYGLPRLLCGPELHTPMWVFPLTIMTLSSEQKQYAAPQN